MNNISLRRESPTGKYDIRVYTTNSVKLMQCYIILLIKLVIIIPDDSNNAKRFKPSNIAVYFIKF